MGVYKVHINITVGLGLVLGLMRWLGLVLRLGSV